MKLNTTYIYHARIIIECKSALCIKSGHDNSLTDNEIVKDMNGLPMILGASIAGLLFANINSDLKSHFGKAEGNTMDFEKSDIYVGNALLISPDNIIYEEMMDLELRDSNKFPFHSKYFDLPIRDHVSINISGTSDTGGKFDQTVVYKGTRFAFDVSFKTLKKDDSKWDNILCLFGSDKFKLGSKKTSGFGRMKLCKLLTREFDLTKDSDFKAYLNFENRLTDPTNCKLNLKDFIEKDIKNTSLEKIDLSLIIENANALHFGASMGSFETNGVDNEILMEEYVDYNLSENWFIPAYLIPFSSIKGLISHKSTYYYNKMAGIYINEAKCLKEQYESLADNNTSVKNVVFGYTKGMESNIGFFEGEDIYLDIDTVKTKVFQHNAIDRFTNETIGGVLFQENTLSIYKSDVDLILELNLNKKFEEMDEKYIRSIVYAIEDIRTSLTAIGGKSNKGHGLIEANWKDEAIVSKYLSK